MQGKNRRKSAGADLRLQVVNEHFETVFNTAETTQIENQ